MQGDCALNPTTVQAVTGEQDTLAAPPPAQYAPTGQASVEVGEVEPGGQKYPGVAVQPPEQAGVERPVVDPYFPAGQSVG